MILLLLARTSFLSSLAVILSLFVPSSAQCVTHTGGNITNVYFSSGIGTNSDQTNRVTAQLCATYQFNLGGLRDGQPAFANEHYNFSSSINETQGLITDVIQVLLQKAQELSILDRGLGGFEILNWINNRLSVDDIKLLIQLSSVIEDKAAVSANITDANLIDLAATLLNALPNAMADQRSVETLHELNYRNDLQAGKRVIVMAHSQGNLFTNKVVSLIKTSNPELRASIEIIGIASPAAMTSILGFYVTAKDDEIIELLRSLVFDVAAGNIDNHPILGGDIREGTNHNFNLSYFQFGLPSRDKIDAEIIRLATTMPYPNADTPGAIKFVSFTQGDPGIPGDGLTVTRPRATLLVLDTPYALTGVTDGVTITVYQEPRPFGDIRVGFGLSPYDASCQGDANSTNNSVFDTIEVPLYNGVSGTAYTWSQAGIQSAVDDLINIAQCAPGLNSVDDAYITAIGINSSRQTFDAVAIGFGQNAIPVP